MLYDPKWEVKVDPLSKESLIAWLEKQDPWQNYTFIDSSNCLLAQFAKSIDSSAIVDDNPVVDSYHYLIDGKSINFGRF
jgi:hypothetical protein